jgi:hypothetical protein
MKRRSFLKSAAWLGCSKLCCGYLINRSFASQQVFGAEAVEKILHAAVEEELAVVTPVDHGQALLNPGMGFNFPYFTDNQDASYGGSRPIDDTLDWFPGVNAVYFRVGWGHLEPQEGVFNWDYTDRIAKHWIAKGKQVAYCWIVFSTVGSTPATPTWLKDCGAQGWYFSQTDGASHPQWIPNWDDPIFLDKFSAFLAAAAERYDGKPWVQFIELGSLGTWGEGHTGIGFGVPPPKIPAITSAAQKKHIDLLRQHFQKSVLLINHAYEQVSWERQASGTEENGPVEYASSLGYGLTDWSIMVEACCPYSSGRLAESIWPHHPVGLECEHYGMAYRDTKSWGDGTAYQDAMERYHSSFLRIHWRPDEFLNGNGTDLPGNFELVKQMNRRVGYRLQVVRATWPTHVRTGTSIGCTISLRNAGVAPCYDGGFLCLSLVDSGDQPVVEICDKAFDVVHLAVGQSVDQAPLVHRSITLPIPNDIAPGEYNVCVSVKRKDGASYYRLPISDWSETGQHRLGSISVCC